MEVHRVGKYKICDYVKTNFGFSRIANPHFPQPKIKPLHPWLLILLKIKLTLTVIVIMTNNY